MALSPGARDPGPVDEPWAGENKHIHIIYIHIIYIHYLYIYIYIIYIIYIYIHIIYIIPTVYGVVTVVHSRHLESKSINLTKPRDAVDHQL